MEQVLNMNLKDYFSVTKRTARAEQRKEKRMMRKQNINNSCQKFFRIVKKLLVWTLAIGGMLIVGGITLLAVKGNIFPAAITTNRAEVTDVIVSEKLSNIGELITQEDRLSDMETIKDSKMLFDKAKIPGTLKELIYSYDVVVKAGYNFEKINFSIEDHVINVKLPKAEILDCYIENEKLIDSKNNIFNPTTGDEFLNRKEELKTKSLDKAIGSGVLDKAEENAKNIICDVLQFEGYVVSF